MKKTLSLLTLALVLTCTTLFGAAPFEYMPVLTNLLNLTISTNIPGAGILPANRVTAFLSGITATNQAGYSGWYLFLADSVKATNAPTTGSTNVFRSIYWDTKTGQTSTGRWEQVSWDIAAGSIGGGQPLTKTDGNNVTLTLGGTPETSLLQSVSLTLGWTGYLSTTNGGTGTNTFTSDGLLYGNGSGPVLSTAQGGANTVAVANGGAPSFSSAITVGTSVTSPLLIATTSLSAPSILGGSLTVTNATSTGSLSVVTNAIVGGTLGVTGVLTASTSINTPIGTFGTLTVTNHTSTGSLAVVTNATVGGTLVVTGTVNGGTLSGNNTGDQTISLSGAVYGSGVGAITTTLKTNVTAGAGSVITFDQFGLVTGTNDFNFASMGTGILPVVGGGSGTNTIPAGILNTAGGTSRFTSVTGTDTRVPFWSGTGTTFSDDADLTFSTDTLTATKLVAPTSVSTPLLTNSSGALTVSPAAGSSVVITTSTTGTLAVNSSDLVVTNHLVGIGTTGPEGTLEVSNTGSTQLILRNATESVNNTAQLRFLTGTGAPANGNQIASIMGLITQANPSSLVGALTFHTNAGDSEAEAMRITGGGNVGIGTTEPYSKLSISKGALPTTYTTGDSYLSIGGLDEALNGLALINFGYSGLGSQYSPAYMGFLETTFTGSEKGDLVFGTRDVTTNTQASERMRINSAGNVGIGTTGPSATLHVIGGARVGAGADPGANNLAVVGNTTAASLTATSFAQFTFATGDRVAVFAASGYLTNAVATIAEVNFLSGVTTNIQTAFNARVLVPIRAAGNPTTLGTVGAGDGQMFVDTSTWNRWWWNAALAVWEP